MEDYHLNVVNGWISPYSLKEILNSFGFVYEIEHIPTGRKYIGKKQVYNTIKRPPLKGKKRRRISKKESDWDNYWGSSKWLQEDIERDGIEAFRKRILALCKTKGELGYLEAVIQIRRNVLTETLPNGEKAYYNGAIGNKQYGFVSLNTISKENEDILYS